MAGIHDFARLLIPNRTPPGGVVRSVGAMPVIAPASVMPQILSRSGRDNEAVQLLVNQYDRGNFDVEMVQLGYAIGYKTRNWPLVVRSLELRNVNWPALAADGHFRLGKVFLETEIQDRARAVLEFRSGLVAVPTEQKDNYLRQVPKSLSAEITKAAQGGL